MTSRDLNKNGVTVVSTGLKQVSVSTGPNGRVSASRNSVSLGAVIRPPTGFVNVQQKSKTLFVRAAPGPQGAQGPAGAQGLPGPVGPAGSGTGEEELYSTRVDFVSESLLYKGEAAVGSGDSEPKWRIRKITIGDDGDIAEIWANGNADFINVWDNRTSLAYS